MKKGHTQHTLQNKISRVLIITIIIASFGIIISNAVSAAVCNDGVSATGCVCGFVSNLGFVPNSSKGFGQIIIGGAFSTIISCNETASDGICPEDFVDTSQVPAVVGNCGGCIDPDCTVINPTSGTGYVGGQVTAASGGKPVDRAVIIGHPTKFNSNATLERNTTTGINGVYNSTEFLTGTYYFSASKDGYDTQLIEETVERGKVLQMDFELQNGTCHNDCTNSYNRCNAACDKVTFANNTAQCRFYNSTVRDMCNNKLKGTEVYLGPATGNSSWFVACCDNNPYTKYYYNAFIDGNNIKNLIKTEKIARYNDVPVRVIVAYW